MAAKTPHSHWDHYDADNEAAAWNELHELALSDRAAFNAAPLSMKLASLAYSYGYGEADSHITDHGLEPADDEGDEIAAHRQVYADYQNGDYWNCIDKSERLMIEAVGASDAESVASIRAIAQAQRDAFESGREARTELAQAPRPA